MYSVNRAVASQSLKAVCAARFAPSNTPGRHGAASDQSKQRHGSQNTINEPGRPPLPAQSSSSVSQSCPEKLPQEQHRTIETGRESQSRKLAQTGVIYEMQSHTVRPDQRTEYINTHCGEVVKAALKNQKVKSNLVGSWMVEASMTGGKFLSCPVSPLQISARYLHKLPTSKGVTRPSNGTCELCNADYAHLMDLFKFFDNAKEEEIRFEAKLYEFLMLLLQFTVPKGLHDTPQGVISSAAKNKRKIPDSLIEMAAKEGPVPPNLEKERFILMCCEVKFKKYDQEKAASQLLEQLDECFKSGRASPVGVYGFAMWNLHGKLFFKESLKAPAKEITIWKHIIDSNIPSVINAVLKEVRRLTIEHLEAQYRQPAGAKMLQASNGKGASKG
ncbi:uncharacterized protein LOC129601149 [Paramacrobiotus metropolitanus]|uniref:uncharacterized protein LOC129601149 n=1 Tax=Paramacrobiotus metropolitanus TaxID=2943436 RepID=UPI002445B9E6|nr:uncharacterized protein LOC129601149 [Paramacrobiotus metropolitanus]